MDRILLYKNHLKELLSEDRVLQVLVSLKSHVDKQTSLYDELIILSRQFNRLEKDRRIGTYLFSELRQVDNQLLQSLLSLINAIQEEDLVDSQLCNETHTLSTTDGIL